MNFKKLNKKQDVQNEKLQNKYLEFENLLAELDKKEIPTEIIEKINSKIDTFNSFSGTDKEVLNLLKKAQTSVLKIIEEKLKLVPKNTFRLRWLAIGMSVFGVPLGVSFGYAADNMGLLAIGLPIGMVIGMAIGVGMDKKAHDEGRQLDIEIKH